MVTIAAALMSLSVAAHNPGKDPDSYCVKKNKSGKMIVVHNGSELKETIELKDGTRLKPNGTIVFTDGKRVKLEKGECVDENNLDHFAERKGMIEEKIDRTEKKAEKKFDKEEDKADRKLDKEEDKAERKMDKAEKKADRKADKAKKDARDTKDDVKEDVDREFDK
jgi:hypothetical protein